MKKFSFIITFIVLSVILALSSCKSKLSIPANESTEQVAPDDTSAEEEAPAEDIPAEIPAEAPTK